MSLRVQYTVLIFILLFFCLLDLTDSVCMNSIVEL